MNTTLGDMCVEYIFEGSRVDYETIMFVAEKDGSFAPVKTLYRPDEIIAVQSSGLDCVYAEGEDYIIADGGIMPTPNTRMPYFGYDRYYLSEPSPNGSFPMADGHLVFAEGAYFHQRQVSVSYRHSEKWGGPLPENKSAKFQKTHEKLKNGEKVHILFNGDSITTGANSSGCEAIGVKPHIPPFPALFADKIEKTYNAKIGLENIAVGGTSSAWGVEQSAKYLKEAKPVDLYVVAFGMNDGSGRIPAGEYISNIKKIITGARAIYPTCEFVLIAPMLPNPVLPGFDGTQRDYAGPLLGLEEEFAGVAVANVTEMHDYLLTKKRYQDMTGNNVNHPNDFLARIYAQILLKTFGV